MFSACNSSDYINGQSYVPNNNTILAAPFNPQLLQLYNAQHANQPTPSNANYYLPQQQLINPLDHSSQQTSNNTHYSYHMSSTSDDETTEPDINKNSWQDVKQKVRQTKRRKIAAPNNHNITLSNRFSQLTEEEAATSNKQANNKNPKPPPIFVYGVINFQEMIKKLSEIVEIEQYTTKTLADNTIKINCNLPDTYRKIIHYMRENDVVHHTYQLKEDRAYRVVIKNLHYSTDIKEIEEEISKLGHKIRNILNIKRRATKEPLNMFFVDLEPADNNKHIYQVYKINNQVIVIEPPKKINGIVQCMRCQQYGHTKTYCNKPFVCVRCGGSHSTANCKKDKDTPAICALCGGNHTANYRGCEFYHSLLKKPNNTNNRLNIQQNKSTVPIPPNPIQTSFVQQGISYANATAGIRTSGHNFNSHAQNPGNEHRDQNISSIMSNFLEEFKSMFQQLMQQNSMVLNMLSTLVNRIH